MAVLWQTLNFLIGFTLVVALAYWTARYLGGQWGFRARGRWLRVVEALPLGRDRAVLLVDVAGRILLVGVGPHGFQVLLHLDDPAAVAQIRAMAPPHAPAEGPGAPFRQVLARLLGRGGQGSGDGG